MPNPTRSNEDTLWYTRPAQLWTEALPIGNGRLGGMVFGGVAEDLLQLNEDTLWSGYPDGWTNAEALGVLPEVRQCLLDGRIGRAQELVERHMAGKWSQSYLPLGDLRVRLHGVESFSAYRRELRLDEAAVLSEFRTSQGTVSRKTFASFAHDVIVYEVESEFPMDASVILGSQLRSSISGAGNVITLWGVAPGWVAPHDKVYENPIVYGEGPETSGMRFCAMVAGTADSERMDTDQLALWFRGFTRLRLVLSAATSFRDRDSHPFVNGLDELALARSKLDRAMGVPGNEHRESHRQRYQLQYQRVELEVDSPTEKRLLPTDQRLLESNPTADPALAVLAFNFGRYLMISCSQPGSQAANLQGIWNKDLRPYWCCNYTTNINTEMNYWGVEIGNLSECHEPLFDLVKSASQHGVRVARDHYGARGWVAHHNLDIWASCVPAGYEGHVDKGAACYAFWPMGGVWLTRHLWEHVLFTRDKAFFALDAWAVMKECAKFCLDWLISDKDGYLVTVPATSPENGYYLETGAHFAIDAGTTSDTESIRDLFQNCLSAILVLGNDEVIADDLRRALGRLRPLRIDAKGTLAEWSQDFQPADPGHRHLSHLYPLFPATYAQGSGDKEVLDACRATLASRLQHGGGGTGWSLIWLVCCFARLGDKRAAETELYRWVRHSTYPNLLDLHPPLSERETDAFQIDGNLGVVAAIGEMLLQSHLGVIHLLPCLPTVWKNGSFHGLRARGGFEISVSWHDGELETATISSSFATSIEVRYRSTTVNLTFERPGVHRLGSGFWSRP